MTDYCTVRDVRNALTPNASEGSDTEYPETAASLPDWQIEDAIHEAMTVVDMHVLPRYKIGEVEAQYKDLNTDDPPVEVITTAQVAKAPIRWWTRSVAAYYATLTFRKNKDLTEDDPVRLRYAAVMLNLAQIRDGRLDLPGFDPADGTATGEVAVVNTYEGKLWGPEDFNLTPEGHNPQIFASRRIW